MDDLNLWPSHAYVPGKTRRHAEDAFDPVKQSAQPGLSADQLAQSSAFRAGLLYLEAGFYWEAHEVFEPVWLVLSELGPERRFVQGLIQIANGFLKIEMERPKAARRLETIARHLIPDPYEGSMMGVELSDVGGMLDALTAQIEYAL